MNRIIVAGAGHGGLIAAAKLAENGYDVTVYEKLQRDDLGHDWEDRFSFSLLEELLGIKESDLSQKFWHYRGDCAFVSPAKRKKVIINYDDKNRQKIMWRKYLINLLIENCIEKKVKIEYGTEITGPVVVNNCVTGINTDKGSFYADMVIDSCGIFSPVRTGLPENFGIERMPKTGDVFYAYRAYFNNAEPDNVPDIPFEVYMYHEGEKGLSWICTSRNYVDILIGRTTELSPEIIEKHVNKFRKEHPWTESRILHGGNCAVIPVRRPLTLMVADGYAAVGDSAFMTTPMNGMGIDLSLQAGKYLADTIISTAENKFSKESLWEYNKAFHKNCGGITAKNEGLKNSILSIPSEGVDFLFESEVIQSSDLAGAGSNTSLSSLLGKFIRGMRKPNYFFALINGLIKGSKVCKLYSNPPETFEKETIRTWSEKIASLDIRI